jgi:hypothetical protein
MAGRAGRAGKDDTGESIIVAETRGAAGKRYPFDALRCQQPAHQSGGGASVFLLDGSRYTDRPDLAKTLSHMRAEASRRAAALTATGTFSYSWLPGGHHDLQQAAGLMLNDVQPICSTLLGMVEDVAADAAQSKAAVLHDAAADVTTAGFQGTDATTRCPLRRLVLELISSRLLSDTRPESLASVASTLLGAYVNSMPAARLSDGPSSATGAPTTTTSGLTNAVLNAINYLISNRFAVLLSQAEKAPTSNPVGGLLRPTQFGLATFMSSFAPEDSLVAAMELQVSNARRHCISLVLNLLCRRRKHVKRGWCLLMIFTSSSTSHPTSWTCALPPRGPQLWLLH